ncbi:DUF6350 family protein [Actinomadura sp. 9N215]|uniref:cell division protein PerM n=1 Tax=Actinomadura sp. 9N215 TaxID=3375150 RepID=UPI0037BAD817
MSEATPGQRAAPGTAGRAAPRPPRDAQPQQEPDPQPQAQAVAARPLYVTGLVAALWCIGIGLAVLTTITLIGWIAAPKTAFGDGMSGVFRTAVNFWLVSHHAGFTYGQGRVGLLPLGVLILPGTLLYRGGGWMIRAAKLPARPSAPAHRHSTDELRSKDRSRTAVVRVAVALAAPYAGLAMLLALAASSPEVRPSAWQALVACFLVAVIAGGLGAARAVVAAQVAAEAKGRRVRSGLGALLRLLPDRPRSLVIGVAGSLAVLLASGAVLVGVSLAMHLGDADHLYDLLAPGVVGGVLLLLVELAFLPNAVIWGMSYAVGPGFSVGAGTSVSPTGVVLDLVPAFPPLAALPQPGPAPALSLIALAAPFLAGAVGGVLTIRSMPTRVSEGAPLWGFLSGALTGAVAALLTALSGGPLGDGRMATVGPSAWQVGLLAALEVGISAAIAAWVANWMVLRRPARAATKARMSKSRSKPEKKTKQAKKKAAGKETVRKRAREVATPMPLSAPVPGDYEARIPEPRAAAAAARPRPPYAPDPLQFEEAEPVLAPRRRVRRTPDPLPDLAEERPEPEPERAPERPPEPESKRAPEPESKRAPEPEPAPELAAGQGSEPAPASASPRDRTVVLEGHLVDDPEPEPSPSAPMPPPPEDPERTENRGGAIYVLREEPGQDD